MTGGLDRIVEPTPAGPVALYRGGTGRAIVLLHGNGHSIHEFDSVIPALADRFALTGWDMPGHGASNGCDIALSIDDRAALLGDLLDRQDVGPAVLVGNSIGAFIAAALAARQPRRVAALLLVEMQIRARSWWDAAWPVVERMFGTPRQDHDTVQARLCAPVGAALLDRWNADRDRAGAAAMIAAMEAIRGHDVLATLAAQTRPVHFLFGEKGPAADCRDAALRAVPHATAQIVADAGHFVSLDRPDALVDAILGAAALSSSRMNESCND